MGKGRPGKKLLAAAQAKGASGARERPGASPQGGQLKTAGKQNHEGAGAVAFGTMDGVITILGILIGVAVASESRAIVLAAALAGGVADGLANASGYHAAIEAQGGYTRRQVWLNTVLCFFSTLIAMMIPTAPFVFLTVSGAIPVALALGIAQLLILGFYVGKSWKVSLEYAGMGLVSAFVCYWVGLFAKGLG